MRHSFCSTALCNNISDKNIWQSPVKDVGMTERSRTTMEEKLVNILNEMAEYLSIAQMKKLQEVLSKSVGQRAGQS